MKIFILGSKKHEDIVKELAAFYSDESKEAAWATSDMDIENLYGKLKDADILIAVPSEEGSLLDFDENTKEVVKAAKDLGINWYIFGGR